MRSQPLRSEMLQVYINGSKRTISALNTHDDLRILFMLLINDSSSIGNEMNATTVLARGDERKPGDLI